MTTAQQLTVRRNDFEPFNDFNAYLGGAWLVSAAALQLFLFQLILTRRFDLICQFEFWPRNEVLHVVVKVRC
jgi:hypothetical protein